MNRIPDYRPELNMDEWVGAHLKKHKLVSYAPHSVAELRRRIRLGVMRRRDRPALIRSFVDATNLYESTTDAARNPPSLSFSRRALTHFVRGLQ